MTLKATSQFSSHNYSFSSFCKFFQLYLRVSAIKIFLSLYPLPIEARTDVIESHWISKRKMVLLCSSCCLLQESEVEQAYRTDTFLICSPFKSETLVSSPYFLLDRSPKACESWANIELTILFIGIPSCCSMVHMIPLFLECPTLLKMLPGVSGTCSTTTCQVPYLP